MASILVVEDSHTLISMVEAMLVQRGHYVWTARDGLSALTWLRAMAPQLMLLDILLPNNVDGFELCQLARGRAGLADMPIIMMSSLNDPKSIQRAYDAGATDFIAKPFTESHLVETLERHLEAINLTPPLGGAKLSSTSR